MRGDDAAAGWMGIAVGAALIIGLTIGVNNGYDREILKDERRPEPVSSPGGSLVQWQVRGNVLTARRPIRVVTEPQRGLFLPMFWRHGEEAGEIERGEVVRVRGVWETYVWRQRVVWLELERTTNTDHGRPVWQMVGNEFVASSNIRAQWAPTETGPPDRND